MEAKAIKKLLATRKFRLAILETIVNSHIEQSRVLTTENRGLRSLQEQQRQTHQRVLQIQQRDLDEIRSANVSQATRLQSLHEEREQLRIDQRALRRGQHDLDETRRANVSAATQLQTLHEECEQLRLKLRTKLELPVTHLYEGLQKQYRELNQRVQDVEERSFWLVGALEASSTRSRDQDRIHTTELNNLSRERHQLVDSYGKQLATLKGEWESQVNSLVLANSKQKSANEALITNLEQQCQTCRENLALPTANKSENSKKATDQSQIQVQSSREAHPPVNTTSADKPAAQPLRFDYSETRGLVPAPSEGKLSLSYTYGVREEAISTRLHDGKLPPGFEAELGAGLYATVYRYNNKTGNLRTWKPDLDGSVCAVKRYAPTADFYKPTTAEAIELIRIGAAQFRQEAEMLKKLRDQPHIVHVLDYFAYSRESDQWPRRYMWLTLYDGSVSDLTQTTPLSDLTSLLLLKHLMRACISMKQQSIINTDIKPNNVLYTRKEIFDADTRTVRSEYLFCIADFGLAEYVNKDEEVPGNGGALHYQAPEVIANQRAVYASDLYNCYVAFLEAHLVGCLIQSADGNWNKSWGGFTEAWEEEDKSGLMELGSEIWLSGRLMSVRPQRKSLKG